MDATEPRSRRGGRETSRWLCAALLGVIAAAIVATAVQLPALVTLAIAATTGWLAVLLSGPWKAIAARQDRDRATRRLTRRLERLVEPERVSLRSILVDRDDDLGDLSRAIYEALKQSVAYRLHASRLEAAMDHNIRRETHRATHRLRRETVTDPLTRLGNRRGLDAWIEDAGRLEGVHSIVAIALDLDRFKQVNDTLGHAVGDECLVFLGGLLGSSLRRDDYAARLGGDEFLVLMPGQTITGAEQVAQRITRLFAQMPWRWHEVARPTVSAGIAGTTVAALGNGQRLLRQADEALYRAKREGRARVVAA